jgi:hypothetical protein
MLALLITYLIAFLTHLIEVGSRTAKGMWLADLQRRDLQPTVRVLEKVKVKKANAT